MRNPINLLSSLQIHSSDRSYTFERLYRNLYNRELENLNLRGGYKKVILDYIAEKYPNLVSLYEMIYQKKDRSYWSVLDEELRRFTADEGLPYLRDDDSIIRPFEEPPIVVNYFFHEEIIPSAKKKERQP